MQAETVYAGFSNTDSVTAGIVIIKIINSYIHGFQQNYNYNLMLTKKNVVNNDIVYNIVLYYSWSPL